MTLAVIASVFLISIPWGLLCWRLRKQRNTALHVQDRALQRALDLGAQADAWRHRAEAVQCGMPVYVVGPAFPPKEGQDA